jgi:hypothetical protein
MSKTTANCHRYDDHGDVPELTMPRSIDDRIHISPSLEAIVSNSCSAMRRPEARCNSRIPVALVTLISVSYF